MGLYIKENDVKVRLAQKVRFTEDDNDKNAMPIALLKRLIEEAEGEVEFDLSPRYATPFVGRSDEAFSKLPARPTREILRTICELKACIRVLETDFGKGSSINGDAYAEKLRDRYTKIVDRIMERKEEGSGTGWKYPPLLNLKPNYFNTESDDGFQGMVLSTSSRESDSYPYRTINDPGLNFYNPGPHEEDLE